MKGFFALVVITILMVNSMYYRYKHQDELKNYNPGTKLISGIGLIIAGIGVACNEVDMPGSKAIFIIGMLISFAVCIPVINKEGEDYYILLQEGKYSRKQLRIIHPLKTWLGHAMGGAGFISRTLLCLTIIGIYPVKLMERMIDTTEYIVEQQELREEAAELERKTELYEINKSIKNSRRG